MYQKHEEILQELEIHLKLYEMMNKLSVSFPQTAMTYLKSKASL